MMDLNKKNVSYYYNGLYYILTIFILGVVALFAGYYILGIVETVVAILLFIFNIVSKKQTEKRVIDMFEKMTVNVGKATRSSLINFPLPTLVINGEGDIKWYNDGFKDIFKETSLFNKNIKEIIPDFSTDEEVFGTSGSLLLDVIYKGHSFKVVGSRTVERNDAYKKSVFVLYFYEITDYVNIKKKYIDEKTFECLIFVDNYDEMMETTKSADMPQLQAQLYKIINDWASENGGVLVKYEKDKYCIIFEYSKFEGFIKTKFDILNKVRAISEGNPIPATISIGIGLNGTNISENDDYAKTAINMALGRGGDQVVIKDKEQFRFYGGVTKEYERSTRVKARVVSFALSGLIGSASNVIVMGHKNADIDTLGAAFGVYRICKIHNRPVNILLETYDQTVKNMLIRLEKSDEYQGVFLNAQQANMKTDKGTLLVVVDTHRPSLVESPTLLSKTEQIVVIDHHRRSAEFIEHTALIYHEAYSSSTCEMMTEILQYTKDKMSLKRLEAECLYAGIVVDTKNFTFKTGVRTFEAASFLRKQGVDTIAIKTMLQQDLSDYVKKASIIKDAQIIRDHIAIGSYEETGSDAVLLGAKTADELLNIKGITASFVLCMSGGGVNISGRSLGSINVQVILEKLGGGGHLTIAAAQLENTTIKEAAEKLKGAIDDYFNETSG